MHHHTQTRRRAHAMTRRAANHTRNDDRPPTRIHTTPGCVARSESDDSTYHRSSARHALRRKSMPRPNPTPPPCRRTRRATPQVVLDDAFAADYKEKLGRLHETFPEATIVAMSATLPLAARLDVARRLGLSGEPEVVRSLGARCARASPGSTRGIPVTQHPISSCSVRGTQAFGSQNHPKRDPKPPAARSGRST